MQLKLDPHEERVVDERIKLDDKIAALDAFIYNIGDDIAGKPEGSRTLSVRFSKLAQAEQSRMQRQLAVMREYSGILTERIEAFPLPPGLMRIPSIAELDRSGA